LIPPDVDAMGWHVEASRARPGRGGSTAQSPR
jgi:hypothetical protein